MNRSDKRRQRKLDRQKSGPGFSAPPASQQDLLNRAIEHHKAGRLADAKSLYETILKAEPNHVRALYMLGILALRVGQPQHAARLISTAIQIKPDVAEMHYNLGKALDAMGDPNCFVHFRHAVHLDADHDAYWDAFANIATRLEFSNADEALLSDLRLLLQRPTVRPHALARSIITALKGAPEFKKILREVDDAAPDDREVFLSAPQKLSQFPLFLDILTLAPLNDLAIERSMQRLRRGLLGIVLQDARDAQGLAFYEALAQQAFINEYIYDAGDSEENQLSVLEDKIATELANTSDVSPVELCVLAMYKPLHIFDWAQNVAETHGAQTVPDLMTRQIAEPLNDLVVRGEIASLTGIEDDVSLAVQDQYEANPYPRWMRTATQDKAITFSESLRGLPFWRQPDSFAPNSPAQVLIAGCGTGQQALDVASGLMDADVLAVDLSRSSLAYARRKTQELKVTNITYAQADIMKLGELDMSFDLIESVGVLHHMKTPERGWRVLTQLLRPGGFMKIGLYSELARKAVVKGRELIAARGYQSTPDDIRKARQEIIDSDNTDFSSLLDMTDFYQLSECRDLLFHVQEHRFTLPQIQNILDKLGLTFLGFELKNANVITQFQTEHPKAGALSDLAAWHDFEVDHPDTFKGMYQFWCQKKLS